MENIILGDCLETLDRIQTQEKIRCCVTSPPYFNLRDYGVDGQIGREQTIDDYVRKLVLVFSKVRKLLSEDGTLWLNLGDGYGKGKQLNGIPWRVAFALQNDGWILRQDIIWHKPNPMPESIKDRCTRSHEYVFLLSKSEKYFFDHRAIMEIAAGGTSKGNSEVLAKQALARTGGLISGGTGKSTLGVSASGKRYRRSVWSIAPSPSKKAHFAVFPPGLVEPCVLAGSESGDIVIDPFFGSGTTGLVAKRLGRGYLGCELNPEYLELAKSRIAADVAKHKND